jgi:hypothetical protein
MSSYVTEKIDHPIRTVNGVPIQVSELVWTNGGRSFDVFVVVNEDVLDYSAVCLTMSASLDDYPTDAQIIDLLDS